MNMIINTCFAIQDVLLFSQNPLENGRHGWARIATMCTPNSASLLYVSDSLNVTRKFSGQQFDKSLNNLVT